MGKPLSRPGCIRKSSCCLEKHRAGDGVVGGRDVGMEGGYGDGYIPQRSIYDTMCINQQIDSHHHHSRGSVRRDGGGDGSFTYSASGSLRASRSPVDMFDSQPRSLTPNPSFVRRLDERVIYDSLKLGGQDGEDGGCHSPGHFNRSVSPSVSSFSAPGVSSSSSKKHHHQHHHHHGDSTKSRDGRHSWKVLTPPKHMECMELTTAEMMDRGGYLNPGHYPPRGQSSSLTSPLISPFSGSPMSSGYHTPVFFSPAKPRPSQSQSLRCSPPHVIQPRHYSQTQSLRLSPPHELRRSPYRAPLVQLSAHDLEHDLRERGGGWGRGDRDREWERERERELERGWAQREWERERERGRIERERARERERRETSTFGTFGYGQPVPLRSDSVFLEPEHGLDTTPLLISQPSPSPSPNAAPRMGTGAVGRNRGGSKIGHDSSGGGVTSKFDNGSVNIVLVDSKPGYGTRMGSEVVTEHMSDIGIQEHWKRQDNGSRGCVMHGSERRMGSQVKTTPGGRDMEGKVQSGMEIRERRGETKNGLRNAKAISKAESTEAFDSNRKSTEKWVGHSDKVLEEIVPIPGMKPEQDTELQEKVSSQNREKNNRTETEVKSQVNEKLVSAVESREEPKVGIDVKTVPMSKSEEVPKSWSQSGTEKESKNETTVVSKPTDSSQTNAQAQSSALAEEKTEVAPSVLQENKLDDSINDFTQPLKSSRSKSKSSKSCSRTRPGTATGLRPGVLSPRQSKRVEDFESRGPPEGIESTWPRRIMVRKRTVRQGGALHNLPILPPLPSVISALEKRRPHLLTDSDKKSTNAINAAGMVGRCSLREPSHPEMGHGSSLLGRASLREQNLEHWRVCRDQEEPRRSRSREKQVTQKKEYTEKEERKGKEENAEKERIVEKVGLLEDNKKLKVEKPVEEKSQDNPIRKEGEKRIQAVEMKSEKVEDTDIKLQDQTQDKPRQDLEEVMVISYKEESEVEGREVRTSGEEGAVEGWDAVLDMVNTLWDNTWEKQEAEDGGADTDSLPGSLQRWPLLRPPVGFGGSHPPSSAASELSLTELERRARELDSDLEHLDLSQPHRDTQDLYQTLLEPHRERIAMYQTHPGPQREKPALLTGVGSRSQVSLELSAMESPAVDSDKLPADCSTKEDSSPDSNLTLESDSSGVFLSLSNQSQEDAGSDSDQPASGSELGSSNTSLEKDGDEGVLKEWGREESAELQWCYPTLLSTMSHEDMQEDSQRLESESGSMGVDKEQRKNHKLGVVSISKSTIEYTGHKGFISIPQSEGIPQKKNVNTIGFDSHLSVSPSKQAVKHLLDPNQKAIRSSGLDCGDLDPFVQSDSFVYLAVSARPLSGEEPNTVADISSQETELERVQLSAESTKAHIGRANTELDTKPTHLVAHKPEEGDFLCTDSFVYLAAPACLLLGPAGSAPYSGKESDSESSDSGPVDVSVLGCGSVAGDSDWDSDLSDSDPSRSSRISASGNKSAIVARPKRLPVEPDWDLSPVHTESEVINEIFTKQDTSNAGSMGVSATTAAPSPISMETEPVTTTEKPATSLEQLSTTKKVTWQFKPAHRSVCTGSRKEKDNEFSLGRLTEIEGGETSRPSPSSSSSSSPSSSSSG